MRNILACPGCGNRFFKYRDPEASCHYCGTLVKNAIKMSAEERETIRKNFLSAQHAIANKVEPQTEEEHEQDIKDLYG